MLNNPFGIILYLFTNAKTLSLNGPPDNNFRLKSFEFIKKLVLSNTNIDTEKEIIECVSVYFQPFIISPMINISDLFASLPKFIETHNISINSDELLLKLLDYQHPFPILERISTESFDKIKTGDHVVYMIDDNEKQMRNGKNGIRFGMGSRGCPGQNIAIVLFNEMVKELYNDDKNIFCPSINHLYSGRTNDSFSFYKIKSMISVLCVKSIFFNKYNFIILSSIIIYIIL